MHSWIFRHSERLARIYGLSEELLNEPPTAEPEAADSPEGEDTGSEAPAKPVRMGDLRRFLVKPVPRRSA